jgi:hypothetical protein
LKKVLLASSVAAVLAFSATAGASLSPAAYRSQVNAICAKGVAQLNAIARPKSAAGLAAYIQKSATLGDKLLAKITKVTPPASLAPTVAQAIKYQGAFQIGLHSLYAKLKTSSNPTKTFNAAEPALTSLNSKANAAWRKAGLVKCAG